MAKQRPSFGINALINAANTNDRFELLEDDSVLPTDLTNSIHPLFHQLQGIDEMQRALQLASQFILHDRLLEFFVPLLYGREMHDLRSAKNFLCDPLVHASKARRAKLVAAVRQALQCLAKHLDISFVNHKHRMYGSTLAKDATLSLATSCCSAYQKERSPTITLSSRFVDFYKDPQGYVQATRCGQYRHDFLFATTLVHEVVHAVGVMRRGNLIEPYYRLDYPETEWGYAWENFMFGSIFNPQEKGLPGTHLLMRKVWADARAADGVGGKEYCDVSMSWIAQWFRTETWNIIAKKGPTAIVPPVTHFKIQYNFELHAWVVSSDNAEVREDIVVLNTKWRTCEKESAKIYWNHRTPKELQESNLKLPLRVRAVPEPSVVRKLLSSPEPKANTKPTSPTPLVLQPFTAPLTLAYRRSSRCATKRKRRADADNDGDRTVKFVKRSRA